MPSLSTHLECIGNKWLVLEKHVFYSVCNATRCYTSTHSSCKSNDTNNKNKNNNGAIEVLSCSNRSFSVNDVTHHANFLRGSRNAHLLTMSAYHQQRCALHVSEVKSRNVSSAIPTKVETNKQEKAECMSSKSSGKQQHQKQEESVTDYFTSMSEQSLPPPRPPSYVPPHERDINDPSLDYLSHDSPLHKLKNENWLNQVHTQISSFSSSSSSQVSNSHSGNFDSEEKCYHSEHEMLEEGQIWAPELNSPVTPSPFYIDHHAARLQSSSIHGGHSLLDRRSSIDTTELYFTDNAKHETNHCLEEEEQEQLIANNFTVVKPGIAADRPFCALSLPHRTLNGYEEINKVGASNSSNNLNSNVSRETNTHVKPKLEANPVTNSQHTETKTTADPDIITFYGLQENNVSWFKPIFDIESQTYKSNAKGEIYGYANQYNNTQKYLESVLLSKKEEWQHQEQQQQEKEKAREQEHEQNTSFAEMVDRTFEHNQQYAPEKFSSNYLHENGSCQVQHKTQQLTEARNAEYIEQKLQRELKMERYHSRLHNRVFAYSPETTSSSVPHTKRTSAGLLRDKYKHENAKQLRGYAFPPLLELVNLKDSQQMKWLYALESTRNKKSISEKFRQYYYKWKGELDPRDEYVATQVIHPAEDTSLWYRYFNVDAIQRRQIRYMLSDNDYLNMSTAIHVMDTYPYASIMNLLIIFSSIFLLYHLQVHFNALEFYDDYLGLDLREIPEVKKPLLAIIAIVIGFFHLHYPSCMCSIIITRLYRILMRRPIGPPEST